MKHMSQILRKGERGNVLFLILIAVALFAALSYAVTQSTRSGGGDASNETNLISSAQLTQYPAGVRTAVVRMLIGGISMDQLYFNSPSSFDVAGTNNINTDEDRRRAVFHPMGGGAVFAQIPTEVMTSSATSRDWIFTADYEIDRIGTSVAGSPGGNDLIAFLPEMTFNMCRKMNEEVGIGLDGSEVPTAGISAANVPSYATHNMVKGKSPAIANEVDRIEGTHFAGQPFGCFRVDGTSGSTARHVYYHVLIEQ